MNTTNLSNPFDPDRDCNYYINFRWNEKSLWTTGQVGGCQFVTAMAPLKLVGKGRNFDRPMLPDGTDRSQILSKMVTGFGL